MRVLDLFSGIGGFSIGLERAGMHTIAFCEIEPYCRAVLAKHWPGVPILGDICAVGPEQIAALEPIDVICGGFPCQDISAAGAGAGLGGSRSGLWSEYWRLIGEIRPRFVIVENVSALLFRGLGDVLGDLASIGYDTEWHCIPASSVGAPHRRDRVWIVAYPNRDGEHDVSIDAEVAEPSKSMADSAIHGRYPRRPRDTAQEPQRRESDRSGVNGALSDAAGLRGLQCWGLQFAQDCQTQRHLCEWEPEPGVGRVADGIPARVHRLKALGNAVIPQIPEIIGRAIMRMQHVK